MEKIGTKTVSVCPSFQQTKKQLQAMFLRLGGIQWMNPCKAAPYLAVNEEVGYRSPEIFTSLISVIFISIKWSWSLFTDSQRPFCTVLPLY